MNKKDFNKSISYLEDLGREVRKVNAKYGTNENDSFYSHIHENNISYQIVYYISSYIPYELQIYCYGENFNQKKLGEMIAESPEELWKEFKARVRKGDFNEYIQDWV